MRQRQKSSQKDSGILWPNRLLWPILLEKRISKPLWELVAWAHQDLGLWPSTCHLPLCSPTQESRHLGDTGDCWAHSLCAQADTLNFQIHLWKIPFPCQECGYYFERQPLTTQRQALCAQVLAKVLQIIFSASLQPFHQGMGRTVLLVTSAHVCLSGGHFCSCPHVGIST